MLNETEAAERSGPARLPVAPARPAGTVTLTVLYGTQPPAGVKVRVEPEASHDPGIEGVMVGSVGHAARGAENDRVIGELGATFVALAAGEEVVSRSGAGGTVVGA